MTTVDLDFSRYKLGWSDDQIPVFKPKKGINEAIVREMSGIKKEEQWMLDFRLSALKRFEKKPMLPWFATRMPDLDFNDIYYYIKPTENRVERWEDLPDAIKNTYERLGIPEAERKYLAGVTAQYESEVVFHRNREDLERLGVLFCDMDTAVRDYPDLVRKYFGTVIPPNDNKFAALNSAVWSGGSFIYVPPGVNVDQPLQAYFRINTENMGQFERTLIIADEGSQVHYVEGCSAPVYSTDSLHSAVVELVALPGSRITYTTIQNWSNNVYNLVTKRARCEAEARVEWIDGNIGSRLTMKYPSVYLMGPKASGEVLSVAYAGPGQVQDAGAKMVHVRSRNHVNDCFEVNLQRGRIDVLSRTGEGRRGRQGGQELLCAATRCCSTSRASRKPGPTWKWASRMPRLATRPRSPRLVTTSSSI
jgi:Fe-S cluster assembly protein SufB